MQDIKRKKGSFKPIVFTVDLTAIGKTPTDVEDIFFIIKKSVNDSDDNAIMKKTKLLDGISIDSNGKITVPWATTEYDNFKIGKSYVLGVFLKFTGDPVADEDVKELFSISITQDLLHDN